jgi:hypothetical protein
MKRPVLCVLALHLALLPCFADVIPSRRAEKDASSEQAVKARLEQLGMNATSAERHVQDLTSNELAFFAQNPDRVQVAGGLYWYEWLAGVGVIVIVTATIIALHIETE